MTQAPVVQRRDVLKLAGAAVVASVADTAHAAPLLKVQIVSDPDDPVASSAPAQAAITQLKNALRDKGVAVRLVARAEPGADLSILVSSEGRPVPSGFAKPKSALPHPESLRITPGRAALWVSGAAPLGMAYGLLELADRIRYGADARAALTLARTLEETPANTVRSMARSFVSEVEDKPWFYDKAFWTGYLDMLVASRFNRFALFFSFGYDFPLHVTDDYFQLPYPYLVEVPGHDVRLVPPLPAGERERNLEMLRFISSEAARRGLQFQLGVWTHAYEWKDSPDAHHRIDGLTPQTHALYCRDGLAAVLKACPDISGMTFRVHNESGIADGSYNFWKTLFSAIGGAGRPIEIDMHAKGITEAMIADAAATGMPLKVSPKFSGEHMGLGYSQADIREMEVPTPQRLAAAKSLTAGERRFTRYGYADLYQEGRRFDILYRLWPGSQRHLLWGDPATAAAYSRAAAFCGAAGLEICEPLTMKGREGSGTPGGRCAYLDKALDPGVQDWRKFEYEYRLWGRLLYDPEAAPQSWRRYLATTFGPAATSAEEALANASRIIPLITTATIPSTSNRYYWPEMYDNMPIVLGSEPSPYDDTPKPYRFGNCSPLDPQLFASIADQAADLIAGRSTGRYSPAEAAQWLEDYADAAEAAVARMEKQSPATPASRRWQEDALIQAGVGRFFAGKLRAGLLYEVYLETGAIEAGRQAVARYAQGRDAWAKMARRALGVYVPDITYGSMPGIARGQWIDRLGPIDRGLEAMRIATQGPPAGAPDLTSKIDGPTLARILAQANGRPTRVAFDCVHAPAEGFRPGAALDIAVQVRGEAPASADLFYRHVNQGERWRSMAMEAGAGGYRAAIPAAYTASPYPLQYYFRLRKAEDLAAFHPAFNATLSNQPYFAVWRRRN